MGDRGKRLGGGSRPLGSGFSGTGSVRGASRQLLCLAVQLAAAGIQLEQDGLCRLACEPQLAALRVPADPVGGHRRHPGGQQRGTIDDRQVGERTWIAANQHKQRPEPRRHGLLDKGERAGGAVGQDRRRTMGQ